MEFEGEAEDIGPIGEDCEKEEPRDFVVVGVELTVGVSVPVAEAPAGAGVTLGVSVPVAEAPAGAGVTLGVSVPVAEAPAGAGV